MKTATIEYPEYLPLMLKSDEGKLLENIMAFAAVKFYELKKLSLGAASDLAGYSEVDFIRLLSSFNISIFDLSDNELEKDIKNA